MLQIPRKEGRGCSFLRRRTATSAGAEGCHGRQNPRNRRFAGRLAQRRYNLPQTGLFPSEIGKFTPVLMMRETPENGGFCFSIYIYCCEGRRTPLFVDAQPTNRSLLHRIPNHRNLMISEPFLTAEVQFTANTPKLFGKRQI